MLKNETNLKKIEPLLCTLGITLITAQVNVQNSTLEKV